MIISVPGVSRSRCKSSKSGLRVKDTKGVDQPAWNHIINQFLQCGFGTCFIIHWLSPIWISIYKLSFLKEQETQIKSEHNCSLQQDWITFIQISFHMPLVKNIRRLPSSWTTPVSIQRNACSQQNWTTEIRKERLAVGPSGLLLMANSLKVSAIALQYL